MCWEPLLRIIARKLNMLHHVLRTYQTKPLWKASTHNHGNRGSSSTLDMVHNSLIHHIYIWFQTQGDLRCFEKIVMKQRRLLLCILCSWYPMTSGPKRAAIDRQVSIFLAYLLSHWSQLNWYLHNTNIFKVVICFCEISCPLWHIMLQLISCYAIPMVWGVTHIRCLPGNDNGIEFAGLDWNSSCCCT